MIFDTDILIYIQRGNKKALDLVMKANDRQISIITYMELLQCAQNKKQHFVIKDFLQKNSFTILPLTENIGHRAAIYIEEHSLSNSIATNDVLIAATAVERNVFLVSANLKHFKVINELQLKIFRPND